MDDSLKRSQAATQEHMERRIAGRSIMATEAGPIILAKTDIFAPFVEHIRERLNGKAERDTQLAAKLKEAGFKASPMKLPSKLAEAVELLGDRAPEILALSVISERIDEPYAELLYKNRKKHPGEVDAELEDKNKQKRAKHTEAFLYMRIGKHVRRVLALQGMKRSDDKHVQRAAEKISRGNRQTKVDLNYSDWTNEDCARVGDWLNNALEEAFVIERKDGQQVTPEDWLQLFTDAREELMRRHPVMLPHDTPPPPWKSWRKDYGNRLSQTFASDWKKETREDIEAAFNKHFPHAEALNALANVALEFDPVMIDLADQFAARLMNAEWKECKPKCRCKKCRGARLIINRVKSDVGVARASSNPFWLDYVCDFRGRVYATQHLHFGREDHVRALFRFARGKPLGERGVYYLEIHTANCAGHDKQSFEGRQEWVKRNEGEIRKIAADPAGTFTIWKGRDKPFRYVAACRELARAWDNPHRETHLPVELDGSNNGTQHGSLLTLDKKSGQRVNLIPYGGRPESDATPPTDIYKLIAERAFDRVGLDKGWEADYWLQHRANERLTRKLAKAAVVTMQYGSSLDTMAEDIAEAFLDETGAPLPEQPGCKCKCKDWAKKEKGCNKLAKYLARKVHEAASTLLRGPTEMMKALQQLAKHLAKRGELMQWVTQGAFPVRNGYYESIWHRVELPHRSDGNRGPTHKIADGHKPDLIVNKCRSGASANFVHSLDAAHLAKTVLAAANEGIGMLTVHDCYAFLAPNGDRVRDHINAEMKALYSNGYPLIDIIWKNLERVYDHVEHRAPNGLSKPSSFWCANSGEKPKCVVMVPEFGTLDVARMTMKYAFS